MQFKSFLNLNLEQWLTLNDIFLNGGSNETLIIYQTMVQYFYKLKTSNACILLTINQDEKSVEGNTFGWFES